ncbi:MAG: PepSY domain-containing protein [Novosphingobium sp.]
MKELTALLCLPVLLAIPALTTLAQASGEQTQVRKEMRAGNVRSLREIEQRVLPTMPGMEYLGPEYDPTAMAYRLKFIHDGRVVFVDVDARSGAILDQKR